MNDLKKYFSCIALALLCILAGCEKKNTPGGYYDGEYYHDLPSTQWGLDVLDRAKLLAGISWTPLAAVPKAGQAGGYFAAGESVSGIPYSAVASEEGIVGIQTSFYTFLSAISNPGSTIYSTDWRSGGDKSKAARYGCVCSSAVMYAWGCAFGYYTRQIYDEEIPFICKKSDQTLEGLKLFDALCYYSENISAGHILMVYDIARNEQGEIKKLTIFEAIAPSARLITYTLDQFKERIGKFAAPIKIFSVDTGLLSQMEPLPQYVEQKSVAAVSSPSAICLEEGDKRTFAKGNDICLTISSTAYDSVRLYKNDSLFRSDAVAAQIEYKNLPVGTYKANLSDPKDKTSEYTCFEVGEVDFRLSFDGTTLSITCPGNSSRPVYVTMNGGDNQLLKRSDDGVWKITPNSKSTHCRVHFAGQYSGYSGLSKQFR